MNATLAALLLAAVVEEIVFRGGLHECLLRRPGWPTIRRAGLSAANLVTALAFSASHGLFRSWWLALGVIVPALLIGLLYERTRRLLPCIALHAAMNAAWFGVVTVTAG